MFSRKLTTAAIVLARRNFGEADRIVSFYTKDQGRLSLLAKGIRRPKSRKRGHLEVFTHVIFQASFANSGFGLATEVATIDSFNNVRLDLNRSSLGYYFLEVVTKLTHEGESNTQLFDLLLTYFKRLEFETKLKTLKSEFVYDILVLLGYWPKGQKLVNPDKILEEVTERKINSANVAKKVLS